MISQLVFEFTEAIEIATDIIEKNPYGYRNKTLTNIQEIVKNLKIAQADLHNLDNLLESGDEDEFIRRLRDDKTFIKGK